MVAGTWAAFFSDLGEHTFTVAPIAAAADGAAAAAPPTAPPASVTLHYPSMSEALAHGSAIALSAKHAKGHVAWAGEWERRIGHAACEPKIS